MYRYTRDKKTNRDKHCLIMEEILGRALFNFEVVHHRDEDGHNNSPKNLKLMYKWCHAYMHHLGRLKTDKQKESNRRASLKVWEEKEKLIPKGFSKCSKCNQLLPLSSFKKDRYMKRGVYSSCKKCNIKRSS